MYASILSLSPIHDETLRKKVKPFAWKLLLMPNIVLLKHSYQTFELVRTSYKKVCSNRHEIDCFEYF